MCRPEIAEKIGLGHDDIREQEQDKINGFKENMLDKLVDENGCVTIRIGENGEDFQMQVRKPENND